MAEKYIAEHRMELLAQAIRAVERSPELQRFLEKEQREWKRRLERIREGLRRKGFW